MRVTLVITAYSGSDVNLFAKMLKCILSSANNEHFWTKHNPLELFNVYFKDSKAEVDETVKNVMNCIIHYDKYTIPKHILNNFEIILAIDNLKTSECKSSTYNIIDVFKQIMLTVNFSNYRIVYTLQPGNISISRNTAMNIASGEYVFFMDDDDYYINLEYLYKMLMQHRDCDMVCFRIRLGDWTCGSQNTMNTKWFSKRVFKTIKCLPYVVIEDCFFNILSFMFIKKMVVIEQVVLCYERNDRNNNKYKLYNYMIYILSHIHNHKDIVTKEKLLFLLILLTDINDHVRVEQNEVLDNIISKIQNTYNDLRILNKYMFNEEFPNLCDVKLKEDDTYNFYLYCNYIDPVGVPIYVIKDHHLVKYDGVKDVLIRINEWLKVDDLGEINENTELYTMNIKLSDVFKEFVNLNKLIDYNIVTRKRERIEYFPIGNDVETMKRYARRKGKKYNLDFNDEILNDTKVHEIICLD